jgi:hypothetical protein
MLDYRRSASLSAGRFFLGPRAGVLLRPARPEAIRRMVEMGLKAKIGLLARP